MLITLYIIILNSRVLITTDLWARGIDVSKYH